MRLSKAIIVANWPGFRMFFFLSNPWLAQDTSKREIAMNNHVFIIRCYIHAGLNYNKFLLRKSLVACDVLCGTLTRSEDVSYQR